MMISQIVTGDCVSGLFNIGRAAVSPYRPFSHIAVAPTRAGLSSVRAAAVHSPRQYERGQRLWIFWKAQSLTSATISRWYVPDGNSHQWQRLKLAYAARR
jgi:hypothetical protein